jgi:hypothetical protein
VTLYSDVIDMRNYNLTIVNFSYITGQILITYTLNIINLEINSDQEYISSLETVIVTKLCSGFLRQVSPQ